MIWIYSVILAKFSQSRKALKSLQKSMEETDFRNIKFHQSRGIFRKKLLFEMSTEPIQTLSLKNLEGFQEKVLTKGYQERKQRSSSVARKTTILVSHARAATYILVLVVTLFITVMPIDVFSVYESISHMMNADMLLPNGTANITMVFTCFKTALQNKECFTEILVENHQHQEYKKIIKKWLTMKNQMLLNMFLGPSWYC